MLFRSNTMAKQSLNVGTTPNDGTGDSLRFGASKINGMVDELYQALGNGTSLQISIDDTTAAKVLRSNGTNFIPAVLSYNDLSNLPTIPSAQVNTDWNASSGVAQILNKPTLATVATTGNSVSLNWNTYTDIPSLPAANVKDGMVAKVVSTGRLYYAHSNAWNRIANYSELSSQTGLQLRTTVSGTTTILSNNASGNIAVTGFKSYLLYKIQTNIAARVILYTDTTARTADANRAEGVSYSPNSGVLAEYITSGPQTITLAPVVTGYNNDDTVGSNIYMKVTNKSGSANTVTVSLTILQLEA